jgi:hypothetical protein
MVELPFRPQIVQLFIHKPKAFFQGEPPFKPLDKGLKQKT